MKQPALAAVAACVLFGLLIGSINTGIAVQPPAWDINKLMGHPSAMVFVDPTSDSVIAWSRNQGAMENANKWFEGSNLMVEVDGIVAPVESMNVPSVTFYSDEWFFNFIIDGTSVEINEGWNTISQEMAVKIGLITPPGATAKFL